MLKEPSHQKIKGLLRPFAIQFRSLRDYLPRLLGTQTHPPIGRKPAFDEETELWFRNRLSSTKSYLEYGAGASTLLAADAMISAISIESDKDYAAVVRAALPQKNLSEVHAIDIGRTGDWGSPLWTLKTAGAVQRWSRYPDAGPLAIKNSDHFPDLVLIDGRFRVACFLAIVKASIQQQRPTEILFDDYAHRPYYKIVEEVAGTPKAIGRAGLFNIRPDEISLEATQALLDAAYSDFS